MKNQTITTFAICVVATFVIGILAIPMQSEAMAAEVNRTDILFDGEKVHGLVRFEFEIYGVRDNGVEDLLITGWLKILPNGNTILKLNPVKNRPVEDPMQEARLGVVYGRLHVKGKILVHSNSELLNKHMDNNTHFQIILSIMQDSYPEGLGLRQLTFDGCHCDDREFQIDSHGYALTTYTFTADRLREA